MDTIKPKIFCSTVYSAKICNIGIAVTQEKNLLSLSLTHFVKDGFTEVLNLTPDVVHSSNDLREIGNTFIRIANELDRSNDYEIGNDE